jgi:hypothetical protein
MRATASVILLRSLLAATASSLPVTVFARPLLTADERALRAIH